MNNRKAKREFQKHTNKTDTKNQKIETQYYDSYKKKIGSPTLWEYVFPIYNCNKIEENSKITNISGTAFYIGNSYFLTASHVLDFNKQFNTHQEIGYLNQIEDGCVARYNFKIVERFVSLDIAIICCEEIVNQEKKPELFHWHYSGLKYYSTVRAMGYPSGYDPTRKFTTPRAFQGTRVGSIQYSRNDLNVYCYELSFHCLRGLSGTCLIDEGYQIHGVVIGNSKEELNYYEEIEEETKTTEVTKEKYTYMKSEVVYIGLAVDKTEIFRLHSDHFGMTIHEYLKTNKIHRCHCS
ncbi:MAG TPA: trypsin-like peptidase domain-containing protein [Saprospiraceae bacterium]|nr:trypsin-like peptidase domain-containing protein [Saprospiraceae bacterium]